MENFKIELDKSGQIYTLWFQDVLCLLSGNSNGQDLVGLKPRKLGVFSFYESEI